MRLNWKQICDARKGNPKGRGRERKAELEHDISKLTSNKARIEATISTIVNNSSTGGISELGSSQVGNSFGG